MIGSRRHVPVQDRRGFEAFFAVAALEMMLGALGVVAQAYFQWTETIRTASIIIGIIGLLGWVTAEGMSRPPQNGPSQFLQSRHKLNKQEASNKKVLACLGDSLTHGRCSDNWTDRITQDPRLQRSPLLVINAAQNSICTHTVLEERVHHVQACKPDYVAVLIGSNDVMCIHRDDWAKDKIKMWTLPERPTLQILEHNLNGIVQYLITNTDAKVGLATLPPMGEDFTARINDLIRQVNTIIHKIGQQYKQTNRVTVLEVYDRLKAEIVSRRAGSNNKIHSADDFLPAIMLMGMLHSVMGISWKSLSRTITGNTVLSDSLHLNEDGGNILVDTVVEWLLHNNVLQS